MNHRKCSISGLLTPDDIPEHRMSLLIALLFLSGCGIVVEGELEKGIELCATNGGIERISPHPNSSTFRCKNGAEFTISPHGNIK